MVAAVSSTARKDAGQRDGWRTVLLIAAAADDGVSTVLSTDNDVLCPWTVASVQIYFLGGDRWRG